MNSHLKHGSLSNNALILQVTFESLLATFLSRPRRPKSADTLADTKQPLPFLSPSTADIPQEIKEDWKTIATLETDVHELTLMTCGVSAEAKEGGGASGGVMWMEEVLVVVLCGG